MRTTDTGEGAGLLEQYRLRGEAELLQFREDAALGTDSGQQESLAAVVLGEALEVLHLQPLAETQAAEVDRAERVLRLALLLVPEPLVDLDQSALPASGPSPCSSRSSDSLLLPANERSTSSRSISG